MVPVVDIAIGMNMIADIVEKIESHHEVTITPDNIGDYISQRKKHREELNAQLGITGKNAGMPSGS